MRGIDLAAASVVDRLAVVTAADQDAYYELDDLEEEVLVFLVAAVAEGSVYNPVEALAVRLPFFSCALEVETVPPDSNSPDLFPPTRPPPNSAQTQPPSPAVD